MTYTWGDSTFSHGPEGTPQGPATRTGDGRRRVAFVGDSVCYGFFASGEANLTRRCEAALDPARTECLNFGVPGYNAHMVSATLREQALEFEPRAVVYVFHQNDLVNASFAGAYQARPGVFRERYDLPAPFLKRALSRSRALSFLVARLRSGERARPSPAPSPPPTPAAPAPRADTPYTRQLRALLLEPGEHAAYFRAHLKAMRDACQARQIPFALLFVPREETLAQDSAGTYRDALQRLCAELKVPFLDGQAALAAPPPAPLFGDPGHPNAAGHDRLAQACLPWLRGALGAQ